jgi:type I restriction enzyme S subunit
MEQVLYELPEGWEWHKLVNLTTKIGSGATPRGGEKAYKESGISLIRSLNVHDCQFKLKRLAFIDDDQAYALKNVIVKPGDVLLNITGASIARSCIVPDECLPARVNQHVTILRVNKNIDNGFLNYLVVSPKFKANLLWQGAGGATRQALTKTMIEQLDIPLPLISEQKRIVKKLDGLLTRIDTAIEHLQESITLADALYASSLDMLFEKIYTGYKTRLLSSLANKIGSGATPKGGQKAYKESGISLIRSLNVHDSIFKSKGLAFIDDEQANKLSNVEIETGDVLLNITGASIARCCIAPIGFLPARVNQHVCIIRPSEKLSSKYLNYLLVSPKFKAALLFQGAGGATRQALTKVMISNFEIPLPPIDVQLKLVEKVDILDEKNRSLKKQISSKVEDLKALKSSILDSAFKGDL